ncbi:acyl-CoA dehydrogenase family protein [Rhizobium leguminosarum]|uniref:acyl-CoA dehydrogenase family protein n=1 Tax=Rhizobium leguminosarum TaxID=384 RepID=UPI0024A93667|nr:acyl-CoA dehydrogenase family protein [Rhizobium leguminosarum]MDI5929579.1 acyl-CoA dehydrogenase family protein [Rhizobium leguminosarum]
MNIHKNAVVEPATNMLDRARAIAPLVRAEADESERIGTMTEKVVAAMREQDLFWMLVPRELGGQQTPMTECIEAWEEISAADASAGWSLMANGAVTGTASAFLSDEAVAHMFKGPELPIMAGMLGPGGTAVETPEGLRGSGKYRFGSGALHATWLGAGMFVTDDKILRKLPDGSPQVRVCFLPRDKATFEGNWDVLGLRGTGSVDYSLTDVVVPDGYHNERTIGRGLRSWRLHDIGIAGMSCAGHASVALGLMKRALEEITRVAFAKKRPAYQTVLGEQPVFRHDFAHHEAAYHAARAYTLTLYAETQAFLESGGELTLSQRKRLQQNVIYVHKVAADVVRFCYTMGGSEALRVPSDLGRCMRDLCGATQHIFVDTIALQDIGVPILDDWKEIAAVNALPAR